MSRTLFANPHARRGRFALLASVGAVGFALIAAGPAAAHHAGRPHRPQDVRVVAFTVNSITLAWERTSAKTRLTKDYVRVGTTTRTRHVFAKLDCGRVYRLGVRAVDRRGRISTASVRWARTRSCAPAPKQPPQLSGAAQDGELLVSSAGSWSGATPMTYAYRWLRCDATGNGCSPIDGGLGEDYLATAADIGSTLRTQVAAANVYGSALATSAPTAPVAAAEPPPPPPDDPLPPPPPDPGKSVYLIDQSFNCRGPVDLDLVRVTMRTAVDDAIHLRPGCTGRIGRVEIDTWTADGIKVNPEYAPVPQDIVIGSGYINCHERYGSVHQDGIQVMGGERIVFQGLVVRCTTAGNAQFFVSAAVGGMPKDIVCRGCLLGPGGSTTLRIEESYRSGARDTLLCKARYFWSVFEGGAIDAVNVNNTDLTTTDPRCS
jgi:hypothetical protein